MENRMTAEERAEWIKAENEQMEKNFVKSQERNLRRKLAKEGYILKKSRVRNPNINDFGMYQIIDGMNNRIEAGEKFDLTLEEVEDYANFYCGEK